ncbi:MAG TPA: helicase-related protein [Oligoflexus sp.]|uniref:DEAD/DEAH box helicase n=1 Tax=Oligoflexus sp. TaxID=1971216 RepID=UPI002D43E384|nr:helicase-related protein [Oligoflexus sp.]HYX36920.1 helicase-related protein [Oligoflexus sp.]
MRLKYPRPVTFKEELAKDFSRAGIGARHITGYTKNRDEILEAFRSGDLQVITNFGVLTEGFDDPSIECVLLARPTTSPLVYSQCLGRGLRSHPGKSLCTVIDIIDRTTHQLQYSVYEAAGFKAGWTPSGKDPLREAKAIAKIRVTDPAVFLRIKNALSLAETQQILMNLPEDKVLTGLDGGPNLRYETEAENGQVKSEEALSRIFAISNQLTIDLCGMECEKGRLTIYLPASERDRIPSFFDWHIKNATGIRPELIYSSDEKVLIDELHGES